MSGGINRTMLDYFTEWKQINDNIEPASDKDCVEPLEDESEQASEFLSSVGFADIVSTIKNGDDNHEIYKEWEPFLTKNQMATIRRRVDTLKRKGGRSTRKDVRSLFIDDKLILQKETAEEEPKLFSKKFKRKTSPFKTEVEPELIGSNILLPHFTDHQEDGDDDDTCDGHTAFPMMGSDKLTDICLERTLIDDFGKKDLKMLEALAQIELMGVFDKFRINFTKQKSKRKIKAFRGFEHLDSVKLLICIQSQHAVQHKYFKLIAKTYKDGVFGVRLQTLLERDLKADATSTIPKFFHQLLCHMERNCLKEEGILRLSGSFTRIKEIRNEIDSHWYSNKFCFEGMRPNDSSGLMKVFLRDLPAPLLTYEWIDSFIQISKIPNLVMQIYCLSLLMLLIPEVNRNTLKRLLHFLTKVVEQSESNLMTEDNVAMIMAPNLFLVSPRGSSHSAQPNSGSSAGNVPSDLDKDLTVATMTTNVIQLMIRHLEEMFVVPPSLINQIREKNQESKRKAVKKFWGKKEKSEVNKLPEKIQVMVLLDTHCEEICFKLKPDTTVRDVLRTFLPHIKCDEQTSGNEIMSNFALHEVGGNIEERRLDPISNIHGIIRTNPHARFELRKKPSSLLSSTD